MRYLRQLKAFLGLTRNLLVSYWREYRYICFAKFVRPVTENNKALLIRKRAHHLERFLFEPAAYPETMGSTVAGELEAMLDDESIKIEPGPQKWAARILSEYKTGMSHESYCPMLQNEVPRKRTSLDPTVLMRLLAERRSRRIFVDEPLTVDQKLKLTEAAQHAPSSCNRQTLELIFIDEPELKKFIATTIPGGFQFFHRAPSILVFVSDARDYAYPGDRSAPYIDTAAAVQNVSLLSETMGLGCCWGSYTSFTNIKNESEVRRRLHIPDTHVITASLAIGKSEQFVCKIPRDDSRSRFHDNYFTAPVLS